jgi:23S rRNA (cytidine1920-2'-O)/16S rRNA (cytidine1409-2'-O)-methyltransferase
VDTAFISCNLPVNLWKMSLHRPQKIRVDRLLVERGLAETRQKAQALILAGQVLVDEQKIEKCGTTVRSEARLRLLGEPRRYASRAGFKLEGALDHFAVDPEGKTCLDIGASTGGFTDCLLQRGATRVIAVDAGTNQLDWKLRQDPRVTVMEKTNARYLGFDQVGTLVPLVTMDVSFISSTLILPVLPSLLEEGADLVVLVKPQFEVGSGQVGKGGIVRDPRLHEEAIRKVSRKIADLGFSEMGHVESALPGAEGNREFFLHAIWPKSV